MTNPMINCYVCGSWIKPNRLRIYKCPKCKAKYYMSKEGKVERIYDNKENTNEQRN